MRRALVAWALVLVATMASVPMARAEVAGERVVWECDDPAGDDHGPGSYTYPTNPSFAPYSGHFDLTRFRVTVDDRATNFDVTVARLINTWNAPEGFSHQLVEVFIDTTPGEGSVDSFGSGLNVRFDPRWAPDVYIKILAWGGSRVNVGGQDHPIWAGVLPNTSTIRASVPLELLGEPSESWKYYVVVSSQDGYGPDDHRPVTEEGGQWVFGGGSDSGLCPYAIDILAPDSASKPQYSQLRSWSDADRRLAVLVPANVHEAGVNWAPAAGWAAAGVAALGIGALLARRRALRRKGS